MNQIAIGDSINGFIVLDGQSKAVPNFKATVHFTFSFENFVNEFIDIELKGTFSQISSSIEKLELIIQRAALYNQVAYPSPQYLRFQRESGGSYYYTPITDIYLGASQDAYLTQVRGSKLVTLHYKRANYFDGPQTQLPLTGRAGTFNPPNYYPLINHTDSGVNHGSTVLVKKANFSTHLPAPLRFEYLFDTAGGANVKDVFSGVFHHISYEGDSPFFAYYNTLTGGTNYANAGAIQGNYKRLTWMAASWALLTTYLLDFVFIDYFDGRSFRPIIHLFATHAYTDLYFRVQIERYGDVLYVSEPVYSPPGYGYIILPPIDLPPNYLIREYTASRVQVCLYAYRLAGTSTTIDIDCLTLFPLTYAASFFGFINMTFEQTLIDDSFRSRYNVTTGFGSGETTAQSRVGGPLLLFPNANSRIFFYCTNSTNLMPIAHAADLKVFYRPRLRML